MITKKMILTGGVYRKALKIKEVIGGVNDITPGILANISPK
jgi:hypothetical protein